LFIPPDYLTLTTPHFKYRAVTIIVILIINFETMLSTSNSKISGNDQFWQFPEMIKISLLVFIILIVAGCRNKPERNKIGRASCRERV
jgi:hypothetical protein